MTEDELKHQIVETTLQCERYREVLLSIDRARMMKEAGAAERHLSATWGLEATERERRQAAKALSALQTEKGEEGDNANA